jgi:hypothetical protein
MERVAMADALYTVGGLAGELVLGGLPDDAGAASDLADLQKTYDRWRGTWRWAKNFDRFTSVVMYVAEQALPDDIETFRRVAGFLPARNVVVADELAGLGPFNKWLKPGSDWKPDFWDLVQRATQRIDAQVKAIDQQREFAYRHAQLKAQIAARERVQEERLPIHHPPRMYAIMDAWGR